MTSPLRVGVIGLGPLWQGEFLPALQALRGRFRVACVCDAVPLRAARAARRLRCTAAAGPAELFERHTPEVVLFIDPQWWLLWPLELACRHNVPALCCPSLELEADGAGAMAERAATGGAPVQMALLPRLYPAARKLRELLPTALGEPRKILCQIAAPAGGPAPALLDWIDWCGWIFGSEPVQAQRVAVDGLATALLDFGGGRTAQVTGATSPGAERTIRVEVLADRGTAVLTSPYRLSWQDGNGHYRFKAGRADRLGCVALEAFHEVVTGKRLPECGVTEVYRLLARVAR